jgi:hypothetical protein
MNFWDQLFPPGEATMRTIEVNARVVKKRGRPLLLLPIETSRAVQCLDLYPAQTSRARLAKCALQTALRLSVPFGSERVRISLAPDAPFPRFLCSTANCSGESFPEFGVLAGNPAADSQRFVILLFNPRGQPVAVVKAGVSRYARDLIQREKTFLAAVPPKILGLPRLHSIFESAEVNAFALDFYQGGSPAPNDERMLPDMLNSWISPERKLALREFPEWAVFEREFQRAKVDGAALGQSGDQIVQTAIQHGDLAPWNIKVSPDGRWTVLDWERGRVSGIPGWDWLHYMIQPSILVQKMPIPALENKIEALLASAAFRRYAQKAAIAGIEKVLVLAYLLHEAEVVKPAEGLDETRALLQALSRRWS